MKLLILIFTLIMSLQAQAQYGVDDIIVHPQMGRCTVIAASPSSVFVMVSAPTMAGLTYKPVNPDVFRGCQVIRKVSFITKSQTIQETDSHEEIQTADASDTIQ